MILSKIAERWPESIRCPSASIVSLAAMRAILARDRGSGIGDRGSGIGDRGLGIGNRESGLGIPDSESGVGNPLFGFPITSKPYQLARRIEATAAATMPPIATTGSARPASDSITRVNV